MRLYALFTLLVIAGSTPAMPVFAQGPDAASTPAAAPAPMPPSPAAHAALMDLARQFVARVGKKFDQADEAMGLRKNAPKVVLPEGEILFFNLMLPDGVAVNSIVSTKVGQGGELALSLTDLANALELPIAVDGASGIAEGWYIREDKTFALDLKRRSVRTAEGEFTLSGHVVAEDGDIFAPLPEVSRWFDFEITPRVASLEFVVKSAEPLPIEARLARNGKGIYKKPSPYPELPLHQDAPTGAAFPFVDVTANVGTFKDGQTGDTETSANSSVTTHGDVGGGVLITRSQFNDEDRLSSLRATYRKDSAKADLLGPLKAHTYELGDLTPAQLPLSYHGNLGSGARVTNIDPARNYFNPSTALTGSTTPGWDVELYRGTVLIDRQTVGQDGVYNFSQIDLFRSRNDFRLVFYGPQGQQREETVSVPVDPSRLADQGGVYDIALTADGTQIYRKKDGPDNEGDARLTALYQHAVGDSSAAQLALESGTRGDRRVTTGHAGISTVSGPLLSNLNAAVQDDGEAAVELINTIDIGRHQLRNDLVVASSRFDVNEDAVDRAMVENEFLAYGPSPIGIGRNTQYTLAVDYGILADDVTRTRTDLGLTWLWGRVYFNQHFRYLQTTNVDDTLDSVTVARGSIGNTRINLDVDYNLKPETALDLVELEFQRSLSDSLDLQLTLAHQASDNLDSGRLQANWRTGHGIISPSVSYNSDGDMAAMINTSFGIQRDPLTRDIRFNDEQAGSNGSVAVMVYVDKNGNNIRDDDEDAVEDATIQMAQNGGSAKTDKSGYAFFNRLQNFRQTDVVLVPESLADPYWLPAGRGVSILPREGHLTQLNYPVHLGGEVEGTVFGRGAQGSKAGEGDRIPLRGVSLGLYNAAGKKVMGTISEQDGYYLFAPVPPGDYMMVVDNPRTRGDSWSRPDPTPVAIGFDGTQVLGHDIYLASGPDVAVQVLEGETRVTADDPGLAPKALDDKTVVLNLGAFHSRVLMGVMWYKIRAAATDAVAGLEPLVEPSESYAAPKTGEHTLRISAADLTLEDASKRCRDIVLAGLACTVEILPGGLRVASSGTPATLK